MSSWRRLCGRRASSLGVRAGVVLLLCWCIDPLICDFKLPRCDDDVDDVLILRPVHATHVQQIPSCKRAKRYIDDNTSMITMIFIPIEGIRYINGQ